MKDIPMFTTENGAATLILKEIPYQAAAYVILRHSLEPEKLLEEAVSFCRACGADRVYATGSEILERYPFYTAMWELRCRVEALPETDASLFPVQEQTLDRWRQIYNEKVVRVPNGAWMTVADGKAMLEKGDGYFVHRDGKLLGIGKISGDQLHWVASCAPGAGGTVVAALRHATAADCLTLTVASENHKALALYKALGFTPTRELSKWYRVFGP